MTLLSSLSFLIPCYNDESTIKQVIGEAVAMGRRIAKKFEIVVVNDGSTDKTGSRLVMLVKKYRMLEAKTYSKDEKMTGRDLVTIITHRMNQGYGRTIKELYYAGCYEWLFTIPGDYQIGAKELETILRNFSLSSPLVPMRQSERRRGSRVRKIDSRFRGNGNEDGMPDMILGWRVKRNDPVNRLFSSWMYNALLRLLFGVTIHDANSVRLMRRAILNDIRLASESAFVDAELVIRAKQLGYTVAEVPIAHRSRRDGKSGGGNQLVTMTAAIVDMLRFFL